MVPVLPQQTSWSIEQVWMDSTFLIRILSLLSLLIDKAIAMDTASGRPSGIATIIKTTAVMTIFKSYPRNSAPAPSSLQVPATIELIKTKMRDVPMLMKVARIAYFPIYLAV